MTPSITMNDQPLLLVLASLFHEGLNRLHQVLEPVSRWHWFWTFKLSQRPTLFAGKEHTRLEVPLAALDEVGVGEEDQLLHPIV